MALDNSALSLVSDNSAIVRNNPITVNTLLWVAVLLIVQTNYREWLNGLRKSPIIRSHIIPQRSPKSGCPGTLYFTDFTVFTESPSDGGFHTIKVNSSIMTPTGEITTSVSFMLSVKDPCKVSTFEEFV